MVRKNAVKKKVSESDITVVWGPPGTGKSYTMANIAPIVDEDLLKPYRLLGHLLIEVIHQDLYF